MSQRRQNSRLAGLAWNYTLVALASLIVPLCGLDISLAHMPKLPSPY